MRMLKRLWVWLRSLADVEVYPPNACAICGHGPNPVTGVPIKTVHGTHLHLACMLGAAPRGQFN